MPKKLQTPVSVSSMGAGEVFHFTSKTNKENTSFYLKQNSKKNKAMHLGNFKMYQFDTKDTGIPRDAEFVLKDEQ